MDIACMDFTLPIEKSSSRTEKWIFNHFNETGHVYDITSEFNSHKLIIHPIEPELPPLKNEVNKLIKLSNHDNLAKNKVNASTSRLKKMCIEAGPSMNYTQSRDSIMCTSKSYVLCTSAPKLITPFPNNNYQHITFDKHKLNILSHNTTNKSHKATLCCKSIDTDLHLKVSIKSSNSFPNLGYYQMQVSSKLMPDINQLIPPNSILPFWPINTTYKGVDANKHYHQRKQASIPSKNIKSNSHSSNKQVVSMQHYSMPLDNYHSYGIKSHIEPSLMSHPSIAYWCWVRQAQIQAQMQLQMQMLSHPLNSLNPYNLKGVPIPPPQPIVPPFSLLQKHLFNPKNYNCDVTWCVLNNIQPSSLPLTTETIGENRVMSENVCNEMNEAKASDDMGRHYSSSYAYWNPKRKSFAPINVLNQRKEKSSLSNTKYKLKKTDFHTNKHPATTQHSNNADDESIEEEEEEMEEDVQPKVRPRANTNDISLHQAESGSSFWEEAAAAAASSCKRIASASTLIPPAPPSPSHTPERSISPPENQHKFNSPNHLEFPAQPTIACTEDDKNLALKMEGQMKQGAKDDIDPFSRESEEPHLAFPSPFYYQYPFLQHHQPSYALPKDVNSVAAVASAYESWYQALRHQYVAAVMASTAYSGNYSSGAGNMRLQTPNKDFSTSPLIPEQNSPVLAPSSILPPPPPPYFASPSFANPNLPPYVASNGALEQQQQFYAAAAYYYQAAYAAAQANHEKSARASYFNDAPTLRIRERETLEMPSSPKPRADKVDIIVTKTPETAAIVVAAAESTTSSPSAGPGALKATDDPVSSPNSISEALTTTTTVCGGVDQIKKTSFKIWRQFGQSTSATTLSTASSISAPASTSAGVDKNFVKQQFNLNHILENLKSQQAASSVPYPIGQSPYHSNNHHASTASILAAARNEKFVCPTCSKVFQKQSQLSLHINVHFFERPFKCNACNQRFRIKGLLTKHKCPSKGALSTRSGSNMEASFSAAAGSSLDSCTFTDLSSAFDLSTSFYLSASSASKTNPISSPYRDPGSSANGQPGGGSTPTNDPRPFKCDDCQVAFRIQGHLAKHLRSKMHITGLEKNGKVPCGTYAFFDQRASLNDIDTTSCSASLGSLHRLLQQNSCLEGADLSATTTSATSLALSVNGHTEKGQEISPLASVSSQPESVKTSLQASSKKRPLVVESGGSEEHSNASSAPDALSENPVSISQTHNLEILCSATKYRKKINV